MLSIRCGVLTLRGILLAVSGNAIRVALEGCGDVAEYRRTDEGWVSEFGDAAEMEFAALAVVEHAEEYWTVEPEIAPALHCVV